MRKNDQIGVGVSGTGLGARILRINHVPDSRLRVRALHDPDPQRLHQRYDVGKSIETLAAEFDVPTVTEEYEEILSRPDIAVVAIFSPCHCHFEQIRAALLAGKHVIVTKPMVVSLDEAREVVRLADKTGLKVLVAQSMRWNSMFLGIRRVFDEGRLGDIRLAEAYYMHDMRPVFDASPWRYEIPQDFLYGGVCHPVDLLRWYLGEADEVFAYGTHGGLDPRYPAEKANNFLISLKYRSGVTARVLGAYDLVHPPSFWGMPFHGVGIGLYGTRGSLFNDRVVYEYRGSGEPREEQVLPAGDSDDHAGEVMGFLRHFEECLIEDRKPLIDARDGAQIVAICAACWESIRTGLPARVTREFDRKDA